MADVLEDDTPENVIRPSRPSLTQVKALIGFIQKHPDLAHKNIRCGIARQKIKKLWIQFSNIANSLEGSLKSTKGWIKFWADKRRAVLVKQKHIDSGKIQDTLSATDQEIYDICRSFTVNQRAAKKKKAVKVEPFNGNDDDSRDNLFPENEDLELDGADGRLLSTESEERQLNLMEKLVDVMAQQAAAMAQMAQSSQDNSKALERLAEASHMQALAVDRLASTFESISSSLGTAGGALASIDYTMKRCYPHAPAQGTQNTNLFS